MTTRNGYCRFCGQTMMIEAPETLEQEKVDELATQNCKCEEARNYVEDMQNKDFLERSISDAQENAHKLFDDDWKMCAELFCAAAKSVAIGSIKSISVVHAEKEISAKMVRKTGGVRVIRKDAHTQVEE